MDLLSRIMLWLLAGCFLALATGIVVIQRRARSCPLHDHRAGRAATALAVVCLLASCALVVCSWSW